jgi:hypothetical protein
MLAPPPEAERPPGGLLEIEAVVSFQAISGMYPSAVETASLPVFDGPQ